jgi:ABC-type phosphate/phosphonate transport system substrate-binding protein
MRTSKWAVAGLLTLLGALLLARGDRQAAAGALPGQVVRIGVIGSLFRDTPESLVQVMMRPFKSLLETQTGITGNIIASGDCDRLGAELRADHVQLGVFHGVEFAWARQKNPRLKPLLIAVNHQPVLRANLLVRRNSRVETVEDLRGKVVALPRLSREHCRLYLERRCTGPGGCPDNYFARVTGPHDSEDALDELYEGKADAAVIDAVDWEQYRKDKPRRSAQLRSLQESEPFPPAVVAYYPGGLDEGLLIRLRDGMIGAKSTPRGQQLLHLCRITSFEEVPADYEQMLASIVRAYPPQAPPK